MNNKRGHTLVELIVVMAFISTIVFSVMYVPTGIVSMNKEYTEFSDSVKASNILRETLTKDIQSEHFEILGEKGLKLGTHIYSFENGVVRDGKKLTAVPFEFTLENGKLTVFSEDVSLEYYIHTSMGGGSK